MHIPDHIWELINFNPDFKHCFEMGRDAKLNGPNTTNCHFRLFRTPDHTKAWEAGQESVRKEVHAKRD